MGVGGALSRVAACDEVTGQSRRDRKAKATDMFEHSQYQM